MCFRSFASKKGNCNSETLRKASSILGIQKLKISHKRICCIWLNISCSTVKWIFIWLCPLPFVKYHSLRQIVSKKGNCELKNIKNASSILGNYKLKILHERTCSIWLNSAFCSVKLIFISLCPWQIVKYHPELQFGARHIEPNLAGIAHPHNCILHKESRDYVNHTFSEVVWRSLYSLDSTGFALFDIFHRGFESQSSFWMLEPRPVKCWTKFGFSRRLGGLRVKPVTISLIGLI